MAQTIVTLWQGSEYASGSGYFRVLNILRYVIYATASDIFKALDYLEHFLGIRYTYSFTAGLSSPLSLVKLIFLYTCSTEVKDRVESHPGGNSA